MSQNTKHIQFLLHLDCRGFLVAQQESALNWVQSLGFFKKESRAEGAARLACLCCTSPWTKVAYGPAGSLLETTERLNWAGVHNISQTFWPRIIFALKTSCNLGDESPTNCFRISAGEAIRGAYRHTHSFAWQFSSWVWAESSLRMPEISMVSYPTSRLLRHPAWSSSERENSWTFS